MTTDKLLPMSLEIGDQIIVNNELYTLVKIDSDVDNGYRLVLSDLYDMVKSLIVGDDQYVTVVMENE